MTFQLVDSDWATIIEQAATRCSTSMQVVSPFIKRKAVQRLLSRGRHESLRVITRFNLRDFCQKVSDTSALQLLLESGAEIKGVRGLHAKLYIFGAERAIVTSANLTEAALLSNHEFGCVSDDAAIVGECISYFDRLWTNAGRLLTLEQIAEWEERIRRVQITGARPAALQGLPDEGARVNIVPAIVPGVPYSESADAFVKFFGTQDNRADHAMPILDEIRRSGSHWACAYPNGKRPRKAKDDDVVFISRLVANPIDIMIYGRAIAIRHKPVRDDATPSDIELRNWKATWPHYVRVHHARFIAGTLANGVSLAKVMEDLGSNAFITTQAHTSSGEGNVDPRRSLMRQPAVRLSSVGFAAMEREFADRIERFGRVPETDLEALDWPTVPNLDESDDSSGEAPA